jgi:hypothetical protein
MKNENKTSEGWERRLLAQNLNKMFSRSDSQGINSSDKSWRVPDSPWALCLGVQKIRHAVPQPPGIANSCLCPCREVCSLWEGRGGGGGGGGGDKEQATHDEGVRNLPNARNRTGGRKAEHHMETLLTGNMENDRKFCLRSGVQVWREKGWHRNWETVKRHYTVPR